MRDNKACFGSPKYPCTNQILNYSLRLSYGRARSRLRGWHADGQSRKLSMCDPRGDLSHETPRHRAAGLFSAAPPARAIRARQLFPNSSTGARKWRSPALTRSPVGLRAAGSSGSPVPCSDSAGAAVGAPLRSMRKHLQEPSRRSL